MRTMHFFFTFLSSAFDYNVNMNYCTFVYFATWTTSSKDQCHKSLVRNFMWSISQTNFSIKTVGSTAVKLFIRLYRISSFCLPTSRVQQVLGSSAGPPGCRTQSVKCELCSPGKACCIFVGLVWGSEPVCVCATCHRRWWVIEYISLLARHISNKPVCMRVCVCETSFILIE